MNVPMQRPIDPENWGSQKMRVSVAASMVLLAGAVADEVENGQEVVYPFRIVGAGVTRSADVGLKNLREIGIRDCGQQGRSGCLLWEAQDGDLCGLGIHFCPHVPHFCQDGRHQLEKMRLYCRI